MAIFARHCEEPVSRPSAHRFWHPVPALFLTVAAVTLLGVFFVWLSSGTATAAPATTTSSIHLYARRRASRCADRAGWRGPGQINQLDDELEKATEAYNHLSVKLDSSTFAWPTCGANCSRSRPITIADCRVPRSSRRGVQGRGSRSTPADAASVERGRRPDQSHPRRLPACRAGPGTGRQSP